MKVVEQGPPVLQLINMKYLASYAPLLEKIFLVGLLAGGLFFILHVEPFHLTVTIVSLFGLGTAYYLAAFHEPENAQVGSDATQFKGLLVNRILPKVLWISSAISVIGFAMRLLDSSGGGHQQMLMIAGFVIGTGLLIVIGFALTGKYVVRPMSPPLLRAVPLLFLDCFLLTQ